MKVQLQEGKLVRCSKGHKYLTEKGDFVEVKSIENKNSKLKESYDDYISDKVLPMIKGIMEEFKDGIMSKYECYNYDGEQVETTDGRSYDGFMSSTEGTVTFCGFTLLDYLEGSGSFPSNEKINKVIQEKLEYLHKSAKEDFISENKEEIESLGLEDSQVNYRDLEELGHRELAENLDEYERGYISEQLSFDVHVYFRQDRHDENSYNFYTFSELIFGDYGRYGSGTQAFEGEFDFKKGEDISTKARELIEQAFSSLE